MFRLYLVLIILLFLAGCAQATAPVTTPSPISSVDSLAQIDLEALVLQPGDLPPMDAIPEKIAPLPFVTGSRPGVATSFARLLTHDDYVYGDIYVTVYTDTIDTTKAYEDNVALLKYSEQAGYTLIQPGVGERAVLQYRADDEGALIMFQRCHASVSMSFPALTDATHAKDALLAYAQRLDARLKPFVCP
jgi:hypothetical protein